MKTDRKERVDVEHTITNTYNCKFCNSQNTLKDGKPKFCWGVFMRNGVQPLEIQKIICNNCDKIFGAIDLNEYLKDDILFELGNK